MGLAVGGAKIAILLLRCEWSKIDVVDSLAWQRLYAQGQTHDRRDRKILRTRDELFLARENAKGKGAGRLCSA